MLTQIETRYLAQVTYRDWLPEVYLDQHQMGSGRARIFVPPFKNPPNPNVDPLVWSEVNLLGQAMAARLQEAGKPGVMWGEIYSGFWQGANSTNPWWHNMVALLTEVASARVASPVFQHTAPGRVRLAGVEARPEPGDLQIPPPPDLQFRMNYPQPWVGGRWTFADVVEHHRLAAEGLLDAVAGHRESLEAQLLPDEPPRHRAVRRGTALRLHRASRAARRRAARRSCCASCRVAAPTWTRRAHRSRRRVWSIRPEPP